MLPKRQWARAADNPVATLARFTVVDTAAGERPVAKRMLEDVGPNPIPRAPSTNDARNPATATMTSSVIPNRIYRNCWLDVKAAKDDYGSISQECRARPPSTGMLAPVT